MGGVRARLREQRPDPWADGRFEEELEAARCGGRTLRWE